MTKKKNNAVEGLLWILILLPLIYLASIWSDLPDIVPTHFDLEGNPDDYSKKESLIYLMAGLNFGFYILFKFIPKLDPKKNFNQFSHYPKLRVFLQLFMALISVVIIYSAQSNQVNIIQLLFYLMVFLVIALGNYMQSMKPNYFIGIRTPWTLENSEVWSKTHRVGGKLWFYGGIILLVVNFFLPKEWPLILIVAFMVISGLYLVVFSYQVHKSIKK